MGNPALEKLKAAQSKKPVFLTKTVTVAPTPVLKIASRPPLIPQQKTKSRPVKRPSPHLNGHAPKVLQSSTTSQPIKNKPKERVRHDALPKRKSASPAVATPAFTSSDDDSESESGRNPKRRRVVRKGSVDLNRKIRDADVFDDSVLQSFPMIHAADIANPDIIEHNRTKYTTFFTALGGDEDPDPIIELQYPGSAQRERYQLLRPSDPTDFKPLTEIMENMKRVAEYYLPESDALKIHDESEMSGLVTRLDRAAKRGRQQRIGAQQEFIDVVNEYNTLITTLRSSGTISHILDQLPSLPLPLVEHIVKNQVYARTVSPSIHLVRQYEGFSDNVYGELLPKFLSEIFKATSLKSNHVFVDLGSGVGNCVLQAALETGCEAIGCEIMENPSTLAAAQLTEFHARCKLWGLRPGPVTLLRDDFLTSPAVAAALARADVLLINNQAFTASLNDKLKYKFLDLKEGCRIVSLKPFKDPGMVVKESNVNDPVNILTVEKRERFSGHVSWTDDGGYWYLHRKDGRVLEGFMRRVREGKGLGRVGDGRS